MHPFSSSPWWLCCDMPVRVCQVEGGVGESKFVGILTKCVGKTSWPNVVGKFGVFYHKKTKYRILLTSSAVEIRLLPTMTAFKEVIEDLCEQLG